MLTAQFTANTDKPARSIPPTPANKRADRSPSNNGPGLLLKPQKPPPTEPRVEGAEEPRVNILMVDDTPENLIALEAVLSDLNQNLIKARSGEEALRLLLKQEFAVILLDVNMPGISGFETASLIRQRKSSEHIPIIFVSAISTSDTHLYKGYSLGAVDYIFTPVMPDVLRSKVSVFVELLKKTEEAKRQAEKLRRIEEEAHQRTLSEAARRLELQTKQNRFFTFSVDMLAIAGFDGMIRELNPSWQKVLGHSEEQLKGVPFWEKVHPDEQEEIQDIIEQVIRTRSPEHFESRYVCANGEYRWFSWTIAPYEAEALLYLFARDVTQRKRNEAEIRNLNSDLAQRATLLEKANQELQAEINFRKQAETALQESNSALEAFSYSVSHDLRAPLRAMQGFGRVLLDDYDDVLDDMGKECANRIVTASEKMDCLIQDLLTFSRLGHAKLELMPINLETIIGEILQQLESDLRLKSANINIDKPLPRVLAHQVTLTQVLLNLISNSLKFVAENVRPSIRIHSERNGNFARLWIEDNGIGIRMEDKTRVFRVFERLQGSENFPGTGLGLAIVKKGVERMEGQVGVESTLGEGSRFWIDLKPA
jgi:PAS domain S-box-containing protein